QGQRTRAAIRRGEDVVMRRQRAEGDLVALCANVAQVEDHGEVDQRLGGAHAARQLHQHVGAPGDKARLVAGGTDVLVELSRGVRPTETLIDLTVILDLRYVRTEGDQITLGALATHNDILASADCRARALPL